MRFEFSAGGIVYKKTRSVSSGQDGGLKILVCQHSGHHGWVFPKGLIDKEKGEKKEDTALREVKEETGIEGKIEKALPPSEYWYKWEEETVKKTVYFFIMKYIAGDTKDHDWEMEQVEWIDYNDVASRLTYPSDKKLWEEAKKLITDSQ